MSSAIAALSKRVAAANMELADVGGIVWLEHINLVIADKVRVRAGVRVAILPLEFKNNFTKNSVHRSLSFTKQDTAEYFYMAGLGLTRDPEKGFGTTIWVRQPVLQLYTRSRSTIPFFQIMVHLPTPCSPCFVPITSCDPPCPTST